MDDYPFLLQQSEICDSLVVAKNQKIQLIQSTFKEQQIAIRELTTQLNDETTKRKNARRQRLIWGGVGLLAGYIIYGVVN